MLFARLDPFLLIVVSWALLMLVLSSLQLAVKRKSPVMLQDRRLVLAMFWLVRIFALLTLLLLAGMAQSAASGLPELPRDVTEVPSVQLLDWMRGESAVVHRMKDLLFSTLMYLALMTQAFSWLTTYRRANAEAVSAP
ncbi:MAG TPA: hypothetical protein VFY71_18200 [Planctomycetota bacterium]|nr:hypothetical protein [Planctomycetota bacterium]